MQKTYGVTRTPSQQELRIAYQRLSRTTRSTLDRQVRQECSLDLTAVFADRNSDALTSAHRRRIAQAMHDRGAAFMLSARERF